MAKSKKSKKPKKSAQVKLIGSDNPVTLAREALADTDGASIQRQWRAFVREKHLAEALLEADKTKRAQRKQIKELQVALAKACDWALDSADVIKAYGDVLDPDDGEDVDFREVILGLRKLSMQPFCFRYIERQKQQAVQGLAIAIAEVERTGKGYPPADSIADQGTDS